MYKNFVELESVLVRNKLRTKTLALVCAHEETALKAVIEVANRNYISPLLIGREDEILKLLDGDTSYPIINADTDQEAAFIAVEQVRLGRVDIIMKGHLQTSDLLREVVKRDTGIRQSDVLSHIALIESPFLDTMFMVSDGGMLPYPTLEQKQGIIQNTLNVAQSLNIEQPKVALLDAAEHVNKHIPSSLDSEKLSQQNWNDAIVEGPISIDLALSSEAVKSKGYQGRIQGDADILIVPDIISGNILGKVGTILAPGKMAGIIEGASVPIVLTSRGSSLDEKINSMLLACFIAEKEA